MKTLFLTILLLPLSLPAEDITPEKAQTLLAMKNPPQVIDIRTPGEFAKGHIKGAQLINFFGKDFEKKLAELDPKKTYVTHCKSGGRSGKSLLIWKKLGFTKVYHLQSGFDGWKAAKLPIVKPKSQG
ncbi:MAG: rhodanese-like domain-containing protein [Akkermansiaceae bacterium]|nr:rhodanese-like domain-containing protein [Akkermansiaceae bacterium]